MNPRWIPKVIAASLVVAALQARPIPKLDIDDLAKRADMIVVGRAVSFQERGTEVIEVQGQEVRARALVADIEVHLVIKGQHGLRQVALTLLLPELPVGYQSVPLRQPRLFLIKSENTVQRPLSPYDPSVVATLGVPSRGASTVEQVVAQVAGVLQSPNTTTEEKYQAIHVLRSTKSRSAVAPLRLALSEQSQVIRLSAAAVLLERNDISGLSFAEDALLGPKRSIPANLAHNLMYAISEGIRDEKAIPSLARLMGSSDAKVRRATASALRRIGTTSAIRPLVAALGDGDFETRYFGVVGLAEITGQSEWRPNLREFRSEEKRYLDHWREWARQYKVSS